MYGSDDELVETCIVCHESNTFTVSLRYKKAGEHQSVGSSDGTMIPDLMYRAISLFAGSWNLSGIGLGMHPSFKWMCIFWAHMGFSSRVSENM